MTHARQESAQGPVDASPMHSVRFTLNGQVKSGKNRVLTTRTGHRYPPKAFKVWRDEMVREICMQAGYERSPLLKPVHLTVRYVPGDRIRRDVAGMLDALCHVLERADIVLDDSQVQRVTWVTQTMERGQARCVVTLEEQ